LQWHAQPPEEVQQGKERAPEVFIKGGRIHFIVDDPVPNYPTMVCGVKQQKRDTC
jgi:hypothetical protein